VTTAVGSCHRSRPRSRPRLCRSRPHLYPPSFASLGLSSASSPSFTPASTPALPLRTPRSHLIPTLVPPHSCPCPGAMASVTRRRCGGGGGGDVAAITPSLTPSHPFVRALVPTLLHLVPALTCALFILSFAHSFGCPGPCLFVLVRAYFDLHMLICARLRLWLTTLAGTASWHCIIVC
jgi:hypothetical protein